MAVPTIVHIGRPCIRCTLRRIRGPEGGGGRPVAVRRVGPGGGRGGGHVLPVGGGGGRLGGVGGGGTVKASAGPHARLFGVWGRGLHLVLTAHGGGTPATCVHAIVGWGILGRYSCALQEWRRRHRVPRPCG